MTSSQASSPRIPTLDGWRGIAILLVLVDHTQSSLHGSYYRWSQTGQHGVTIFFVLSGYLITSKLLERPTGLRRFYLRRFFRLMPVAWTYIAFLALLGVKSRLELPSCVLFFRNYLGLLKTPFTNHFWSLSIEEQFYMAWPALLLLLGIRKARWFATFGIFSCAVYRYANWRQYDHLGMNFRTEVRCDALLVGCLLALVLVDQRVSVIARQISKCAALPALLVFAFCITHIIWLPPLYEDVSIAVLLTFTLFHHVGALVFPALLWLGRISYSVYVWQALFMVHWGPITPPLMIFVFLPVFAIGSYYLIERPCTRFAHRLTHQTSRTPAVAHQLPAVY
jgi:peptidoglycan/LPS O-acetylase OafA/YrhL